MPSTKSSGNSAQHPEHISVLFVCLGNICRSTMAEAVFTHLVSSLPKSSTSPTLHIDSAGTGAYHTGSSPDPRTLSTLKDHGITKYRHSARQVTSSDLDNFDYIFAMDRSNLRELKRRAKSKGGDTESKVSLFGSWVEDDRDERRGAEIEDPYYGGDEGFERAFKQTVHFSQGWLRNVLGVDVQIDATGKVTADSKR